MDMVSGREITQRDIAKQAAAILTEVAIDLETLEFESGERKQRQLLGLMGRSHMCIAGLDAMQSGDMLQAKGWLDSANAK